MNRFENYMDRLLASRRLPPDRVNAGCERVLQRLQQESEPAIVMTEGDEGPEVISIRFWRWAVAGAAALLLIAIPIYKEGKTLMQPSESAAVSPLPPIDIPADANGDKLLMDAVNDHISRTMPAPMEPIMALIRTHDDTNPLGGSQ